MTQRRILVIDDEATIRQTLDIALTKAGYEVLQAGDGEEATRVLGDSGADLLIVDIHLPKKSGLEVIMEVRANSPSTPVIAMTDGGRSRNFNPLTYSELLGAVRTIAKPFTLEEMLAMVKQELDH
jgi:DNA-binding response OmpR family regulator